MRAWRKRKPSVVGAGWWSSRPLSVSVWRWRGGGHQGVKGGGGELTAEDGGGLGQRALGRAEAVQAGGQQGGQGRRQPGVVAVRALGQEGHQLLEKQRVALGGRQQAGAPGRVQGGGQVAEQRLAVRRGPRLQGPRGLGPGQQ